MATPLRDLFVRLGVEDGDEALSAAKEFDGALTEIATSMAKVVAAGAAVVTAFAAVAVSAANAGDEVAEGAIRTGIATDAYQELTYAAGQSGLEVAQLETALVKQAASMADAADGTEAAVDAYAALGLTQAELAEMTTDEAFLATATALSEITDEQERLQAAQDIYGAELAGKLLPLMDQGAEGINALAAEAQALGLVMSGEDIEAASEFNDALDAGYQILLSFRNEIGLQLLPILTEWLQAIKTWTANNRELIDTKLEEWVGKITDGLKTLEEVARKVDAFVVEHFGGWEPVLEKGAMLVAGIGAAFLAIKASGVIYAIGTAVAALGAFLGTTLGGVVIAIAAAAAQFVVMGLVIEDLITFFRGGDSVIGRFLDRFRESDGILGAVARAIEVAIGVAGRLISIVTTLGAVWWDVFSNTTLPVLQLVGAAVLWLAEQGFGALGFWLDNVVVPALNLVASVLDFVTSKIAAFMPIIQAATSAVGAFFGMTGEEAPTAEGGGAATATGATASLTDTFASTGAAFAPTTTETAGTAGATSTTATTNVTTGGNTYTIEGVGWTEEDILELIAQAEAEKARQTSAALAGAEV